MRAGDGLGDEGVAREELEVDRVDEAAFSHGDVERNVGFGSDFLFAAFLLAAEREEDGLVGEDRAEFAQGVKRRGRVGDGREVVAPPFEDVEVGGAVGEGFALDGGNVLRHQGDDDLRGAFAQGNVFNLNSLHF